MSIKLDNTIRIKNKCMSVDKYKNQAHNLVYMITIHAYYLRGMAIYPRNWLIMYILPALVSHCSLVLPFHIV